MSIDKAREYLRLAIAELEPPSPAADVIKTPDAFDRALSAATAGTVLTLDPTFVYTAPLKLRQAGVRITAAALGVGRMTIDAPAPRFLGGTAFDADDLVAYGIEFRVPTWTDVVTISGAHCWLDHCRVLGDPVKGAKRGIAANGNGDCRITGCYIEDCFGPYPGQDTQAICAWDMGPGLIIEDNYLSGGSETIMIGGSDPSSADRLPTLISIRHNTITKNPAWQSKLIGVKNTLELKNARDVTIEDNDISYSWGGHGQDGYALMLTVRNQDGTRPESTIADVQIRGNRFAHAAAAINILGRDNNHSSQTMARVRIADNTFEDLDPTKYGAGSKKMIQIAGGPIDLTIDSNLFDGIGLTSALYFAGGPQLEHFTFTNNRYPKTKYVIFGTSSVVAAPGQTPPPAWKQYVASGTLSGNTEV